MTNPGLSIPLSKAHKDETEYRVRTLTTKVDEFTVGLDKMIGNPSHKRQSKKVKAA